MGVAKSLAYSNKFFDFDPEMVRHAKADGLQNTAQHVVLLSEVGKIKSSAFMEIAVADNQYQAEIE